jgi:DNA-directed RNA polymerase specialized sigma24 family protein
MTTQQITQLLVQARQGDSAALDALLVPVERGVESRYFGGLTIPETAEVLGISPTTVAREWAAARAWLRSEILGEEARR